MNGIGGNYCPQCGGIKNLWFKVEMFTAEDIAQGKNQPSSVSKKPFPLCFGHPEPAPEHDGKLDTRPNTDDYHASVEIQEDYGLCDGSKIVEIRGGRGDCENCRVLLEPAQVLSLFAWLKQEEDNLQKLVGQGEA